MSCEHPHPAHRRPCRSPASSSRPLVGRRLGKHAHWIPVLAVVASWAIAMVVVVDRAHRRLRRAAATRSRSGTGSRPARFHVEIGLLRRQADGLPADRRHDDRHARPRLLDRATWPTTRGLLALLRLPQPVHVLDAPARPRRQLADASSSPGSWSGLLELPPHRLLVPQALGGPGEQEGVHRQPRRRRRLRPRDHGHLGQTPGRSTSASRSDADSRRARHLPDPDRGSSPSSSSPARWARAPSSRSTSGCPTRWRARPRSPPSSTPRRWSTPASTSSPGPTRSSPAPRRSMVVVAGDRHLHRDPGRLDRHDPDRHQAGPGLLDALPARLHVRRPRAWAPSTAAIFHLMTHGFFKGLLFLGSGIGDPRRPRGAGHATRWAAWRRRSRSPTGRCSSARWRSPGIPPLAGFFSKDEILGEALQARLLLGLGDRLRRRRHDRLLHVPAHGPDVLGREPGATRRSSRRSTSRRWTMTVPLCCWRSRRRPGLILAWPGPPLGPLFGLEGPGCSPAGSSRSSSTASEILGHARGRAFASSSASTAPSSSSASRSRSSACVAAWRLFGVEIGPAPAARRAGPGHGAHRRASRSSTGPRSTSGGSTTSTTCCSSSSAAASPRSPGGSTGWSSTGPSTASAR